jgi:hypothetical protein
MIRLVRLFILIIFIVPCIFTIGTVASQAYVLGPISVGSHYVDFYKISHAGENLRVATEGLTRKEIAILLRLVVSARAKDTFDSNGTFYRIKMLAEASI